MGHFVPENGTSWYLWISSNNSFKILQNEREAIWKYILPRHFLGSVFVETGRILY